MNAAAPPPSEPVDMGDGRISRRQFVRGVGIAGGASLAVGAAAGYLVGNSSSDAPGSAASGGASAASEAPIVIGTALPLTGGQAAFGKTAQQGQILAIEQINDRGGVLGRPLSAMVLDSQDQAPDLMQSIMQKFVSAKVAAIISPFMTFTSSEFPIVAESGIPTLHVNTWHGNTDYVRQHSVSNIFEADPNETWYGPGFAQFVSDLIAAGNFNPSSRTAAVITSNDPLSLSISNSFVDGIKKRGWTISTFDKFTVPQAEWQPTLLKLRQHPPGVIFHNDFLVGDSAAFIKQFKQSPTPSLLYQFFAPSDPQYMDLAGSDSDGVIWSTVIGTLVGDQRADEFNRAFQARFSAQPGFSNASTQYDVLNLWAQAAANAGDAYNYEEVNSSLSRLVYRGANGAYSFTPGTLSVPSFPAETADPSIGVPQGTYQIQNGKQVLVWPAPYTSGEFVKPTWL